MVTKFLGVTSLGLVARYRGAVDVKGAADLYGQGRSLRQIGAELGLSATTVSEQRRRAGVTLGRGGPPAHPASTQPILGLRDQGPTWNQVAASRRSRCRLSQWPVVLCGSVAMLSGGPWATILPPSGPPPGPKSIT